MTQVTPEKNRELSPHNPKLDEPVDPEAVEEAKNKAEVALIQSEPTTWQIANSVAKEMKEIVPKGLQGRPVAVYALMQYGEELGIGAIQALQSFYIVEGQISSSAEFQRSLVLRAGHTLYPKELSSEKCVMYGRRADNPDIEMEFTWTIEDATRAGVNKPGSAWSKYPQAMCLARASAVVCRAIFADVIKGISYTPEELKEDNAVVFKVENAAINGEPIDTESSDEDYLDEPATQEQGELI